MKNAFYFQHDCNARNDEKILMLRSEYGAEAYAAFFMILETMSEASSCEINRVAIGGLSLGYGIPKDRLTQIIDYSVQIGLLEESQAGAISSPRMKQHLAFRQSLKDAGRAGAEKRWSLSHENRVANGKGKERKGKDIKTTVVFEKSLLRWLHQHGKKENYARWIVDTIAPIETVNAAWSKVLGGKDVTAPSDFVELCKSLSKQ